MSEQTEFTLTYDTLSCQVQILRCNSCLRDPRVISPRRIETRGTVVVHEERLTADTALVSAD